MRIYYSILEIAIIPLGSHNLFFVSDEFLLRPMISFCDFYANICEKLSEFMLLTIYRVL